VILSPPVRTASSQSSRSASWRSAARARRSSVPSSDSYASVRSARTVAGSARTATSGRKSHMGYCTAPSPGRDRRGRPSRPRRASRARGPRHVARRDEDEVGVVEPRLRREAEVERVVARDVEANAGAASTTRSPVSRLSASIGIVGRPPRYPYVAPGSASAGFRGRSRQCPGSGRHWSERASLVRSALDAVERGPPTTVRGELRRTSPTRGATRLNRVARRASAGPPSPPARPPRAARTPVRRGRRPPPRRRARPGRRRPWGRPPRSTRPRWRP